MIRAVSIDRGDFGQRLDLVLFRHLTDLRTSTRTRIQRWITDGCVSVNGSVVTRPAARIPFGASLTVVLDDDQARQIAAPEEHALDVLFEDEFLLAVNKPSGLVVHPSYKHPHGTLLNALLWRARDWPNGARPSLVGRLDKHTSGLVIVAKTGPVHAALQRTLAEPHSEKSYLAVVYGTAVAARGDIRLGLGRDSRDRRRVVTQATGGLPSHTGFERLAQVAAPRAGLSLLRCRLTTGRMHQIRVHLAARGWPIVGDAKYGAPLWQHVDDVRLAAALRAFPRQALHAWRVAFPHPVTGERLSIDATLSVDLRDLLAVTQLGVSL